MFHCSLPRSMPMSLSAAVTVCCVCSRFTFLFVSPSASLCLTVCMSEMCECTPCTFTHTPAYTHIAHITYTICYLCGLLLYCFNRDVPLRHTTTRTRFPLSLSRVLCFVYMHCTLLCSSARALCCSAVQCVAIYCCG